jgi:hypothetical protein
MRWRMRNRGLKERGPRGGIPHITGSIVRGTMELADRSMVLWIGLWRLRRCVLEIEKGLGSVDIVRIGRRIGYVTQVLKT